MTHLSLRPFTNAEHHTWSTLFKGLELCRQTQACDIFAVGVRKLGLNADGVPDLDSVNLRLSKETGWRGIPVDGLEENKHFFRMLAQRTFPIGNFIRDARDVNYTPAPDVFHDLYGHLPFLTNGPYADFCQKLGERAMKRSENELAMTLWGRLFWYGVEFPLVETPAGRRIFGGGILSSLGESNYALSEDPEILPFDVQTIVDRSYNIDEFQKSLFPLPSPQPLYECLDVYENLVEERLSTNAK